MSTILQIQNIDLNELKRLLKEVLAEELLPLKSLLNKDTGPPGQLLPDKLLSMKDAACFLHISTVTLAKCIKAGEFRFCKVGKRRRFKKSDLEKYLMQKKLNNSD